MNNESRKKYVAPRLDSSAPFERLALACTGSGLDEWGNLDDTLPKGGGVGGGFCSEAPYTGMS